MIPRTFAEWQYCITQKCKIAITSEFVRQRLAVYRDHDHPETQQFIRLYGEQHLINIVNWFGAYEHASEMIPSGNNG